MARIYTRSCRDCGARFDLYTRKDRRVRCPECRAARRAANPRPRRTTTQNLTLAEWRHKLECEADASAAMRRAVLWSGLKDAAGRQHWCPVSSCQRSLDATRAVEISGPGGSIILCASCFDRGRARYLRSGRVSVTDGREICDSETRMTAGMLG
jgi:DNA-directed RNA polymerase subunit RPC12/RpoP